MAKKFKFADGAKTNYQTNPLLSGNQKVSAEDLNGQADAFGGKMDATGFAANVDFTTTYQSVIDLPFELNEFVSFQFDDSTFVGVIKLRPQQLTDILTVVGFEISNDTNKWNEAVGFQVLKVNDSGNGTWTKTITGTQQLVLDGTTATTKKEIWELINVIGNNHLGMTILVKDNAGKIHHTYYLKDGNPKVLYGTNLETDQAIPYYINIQDTPDPITIIPFSANATDTNAFVPLHQVISILQGYTTNASFTSTLNGYVTNASLTSTLSGYATKVQINTVVQAAINGILSETLTFIADDGTTQKFKVGKG